MEYENLSKYVDSSQSPKDIGIRDYNQNKKGWVQKFISPYAACKDWDLVAEEEVDHQIFSWPLFTREFCSEIISESEKEPEWGSDRHEHYSTTDKILGSFGMDETYSEVLREFVYPAAKYLYRLEGPDWDDLNFENFIVKYSSDTNKQSSLGIHHDASLITTLVALNQHGEDFIGGGTFYQKQKLLIQKPVGHVIIHPGNITHKHGARPITSGKRYVIVTFSSNK